MARWRAAAALLLISIGALLLVSCRSVPAVRPTERDVFLTMEHDGRAREFILHLPPSHERLGRMPLIIALHGGGGTARGMVALTKGRFNELADEHGFLVAYPQGLEKSWNDDREDPISYAHQNDIDDVGFLSALIERVVREYRADVERVFATGMSNGGFMSLRISREMTDRVRAVAPVCATIPVGATDAYLAAPAMSILPVNGTADPLVPYNGGYVQVLGRKRGAITSTDATVEVFRERSGSSADAIYTELPDADPGDGTRVAKYEYVNPATGDKVVLLKIQGGGHAWPGGWPYLNERLIGRTSMDINACDVIWDFFRSLE